MKRAWPLLLLALLAILFRGPLTAWFRVSPETEQTHRFGEGDRSHLAAALDAYEDARFALFVDDVGPLGPSMETLNQHLGAIEEPGPAADTLQRLQEAATGLARVATPDAAREPFGELSEAVFQLLATDPRLRVGWHAFTCPMAPGFRKWMQKPEHIQNPYMGQEMPACGSESDWTVAQVEHHHTDEDVAYWTCPMHPSVQASEQSPCPICNMDLTPVTHADLRTGDIVVDGARRQRIGVRTTTVRSTSLTKELRLVGEVAWDESRVHDVTARVGGWVESMEVDRVGDPVARGAALLSFYSPELLATQRELLAVRDDPRQRTLARDRLRLWGMPTWAIDRTLERGTPTERISLHAPIAGVVVDKPVNDGARVEPGALLYRIADTSRVWVVASVHEQDLAQVRTGQGVRIDVAGTEREGDISWIYPTVDPATRTGRVRIQLSNSDGQLRPGMLATVHSTVSLGEHLVVPADAVLHTGPRRLVFVDRGEDRLRPVEVQIGVRAGESIAITDGLEAGDTIVASGAFLLAAESRIRSAAETWEAGDAH